jgi:hypothetical protein
LDIDVEYQVFSLPDGLVQGAAVGPIVVIENPRVFEELAAQDTSFELVVADEVIVHSAPLLAARGPCCERDGKDQAGIGGQQPVH